eukprot:scaffold67846_cov60-Phaeocystis_antarctica.AAC.2
MRRPASDRTCQTRVRGNECVRHQRSLTCTLGGCISARDTRRRGEDGCWRSSGGGVLCTAGASLLQKHRQLRRCQLVFTLLDIQPLLEAGDPLALLALEGEDLCLAIRTRGLSGALSLGSGFVCRGRRGEYVHRCRPAALEGSGHHHGHSALVDEISP